MGTKKAARKPSALEQIQQWPKEPKAKPAKPRGVWVIAYEYSGRVLGGWDIYSSAFRTKKNAVEAANFRRGASASYRNVTDPVFIPFKAVIS